MLLNLKDKRGGEKVFSIWWFFILIVVGIGVSAGVLIFYSGGLDARLVESQILYNRLADCVSETGFLKSSFLGSSFDIYKECSLDKDFFSESGDFYFKVIISDEQGNKLKEISGGDLSFEADCLLQESVKGENLPKCTMRKEPILIRDTEIKKAYLEILSASNQKGVKIAK